MGLRKTQLSSGILTNSGICSKCNSGLRHAMDRFQVLQVDIPETNSVLTLSGILENYFSESSDIATMRCRCCTQKKNCPETGVCKPKPFVSKNVIMKSPDILLVQTDTRMKLGQKSRQLCGQMSI